MPSTATYYVNSPVSGTTYYAPSADWIIPNNATSYTVQVQAFASANGGGGLVTAGTLSAICHDQTASVDEATNNAASANTVSQSNSAGCNGTDVHTGGGKWSGSGSPGSLGITITSYTGHPYSQVYVRRSGAWSAGISPIQVRRSGAWVSASVYVRRSGAWVQIA